MKKCPFCAEEIQDEARKCRHCGEFLESPTSPGIRPGDLLGGFKIDKELGRGGMATVYQADDPSLYRKVAIKILPGSLLQDPELAKRFKKEAQIAAGLIHPNIIPIFAVGETGGGQPYYAMTLLGGGSLTDRINSGPMPISEALRIIQDILAGLGFAHSKDVVHRDIKPGNILFNETGSAVIVDFGIARASIGTRVETVSGSLIGTPHYMSPEQWNGKPVDGRSDLYSVGTLLYQMLTGSPPFTGEDVNAIMCGHLLHPAPPPSARISDIPPQLDAILFKALEKTPQMRFQTAEEFHLAIEKEMGISGRTPLPKPDLTKTTPLPAPAPVSSFRPNIPTPPPVLSPPPPPPKRGPNDSTDQSHKAATGPMLLSPESEPKNHVPREIVRDPWFYGSKNEPKNHVSVSSVNGVAAPPPASGLSLFSRPIFWFIAGCLVVPILFIIVVIMVGDANSTIPFSPTPMSGPASSSINQAANPPLASTPSIAPQGINPIGGLLTSSESTIVSASDAQKAIGASETAPGLFPAIAQRFPKGRVLYRGDKTGVYQIFSATLDGKTISQITNASEGVKWFRVSPQGTHIAYIPEEKTVTDENGESLGPPGPPILPGFLLRGRAIRAILKDSPPPWGAPARENIRFIAIDGRSEKGFSEPQLLKGDREITSLAWFPEGDKIAFAVAGLAGKTMQTRFYALPLEESTAELLATIPNAECQITDIASDSGGILFSKREKLTDNQGWEVAYYDLETKELSPYQENGLGARYSPDFKKVVFARFADSNAPELNIATMDDEGNTPRVFTRAKPGKSCLEPAWVPDDSGFYYVYFSGSVHQLWSFTSQGLGFRRLTQSPFNERDPEFVK